MVRYLLFRVGQAVLVLIGAFTLTFLGINALPGDPVSNFLSASGSTIPQSSVDLMKTYYGYNLPLWDQYVHQLEGFVHGNVGYSFVSGLPVTTAIGQAIKPTLQLAGTALAWGLVISFLIVTASALPRGRRVRETVAGIPAFLSAIPTYWLGLVALELLSFRLRAMSMFPDGSALSLIVPGFVIGLYISAPIAQVMVKAVDNAQRLPFVAVLRAKGASESWIYFRHLLKYCSGSAVTLLGLVIGGLVAGAVVTESVFSRQGVGSVLINSVTNEDLALVQGVVLLVAFAYVVVNLLVDLTYPLLDPRITLRTAPARS